MEEQIEMDDVEQAEVVEEPEQVESGILKQTSSQLDSIGLGIPSVDMNDIIPNDFNFGF